MARSPASFGRGGARYKVQPRYLVLCEDVKSSFNYLQDAARYFRSFADVDFSHCGKTDPKGIVNEAIARAKNYDFVYFVIDRDSHQNFDEAMRVANDHSRKLQVIVSYPCYEFWLYLHFRKSRKPYAPAGGKSAADRLISDLRLEVGMQEYAKGAVVSYFDLLLTSLPDARARSSEVLAEALEEECLNPSTQMHLLMDKLEQLGKLKPIA